MLNKKHGFEVNATKEIIDNILNTTTELTNKSKTKKEIEVDNLSYIIENILHIVDKQIILNEEFGIDIINYDNIYWDVIYKLIEIKYGKIILSDINNIISLKIENSPYLNENITNLFEKLKIKNL